MRDRYFILIDKRVVPCSMMEWARWYQLADKGENDTLRRVAQTLVGDVWVSTVFLGLDHGFSMNPEDPPVLFETMCFSDRENFEDFNMQRYCTWDEAEAGHRSVVEALEVLHAAAIDITQTMLQAVRVGVTEGEAFWKRIG